MVGFITGIFLLRGIMENIALAFHIPSRPESRSGGFPANRSNPLRGFSPHSLSIKNKKGRSRGPQTA
jgi:hypothetical protein